MAWMQGRQALAKLPNLLLRGRLDFSWDGVPLVAKGMSLKRRMNALKGGVDLLRRSERMWAMPAAAHIEPTTACQLKCPCCPSGGGRLERPGGTMSMDTFSAIMDALGDTLVCTVLYGWGEPFLNPNMTTIIEGCAKRGIVTITSTNGHCLQTLDEALAVVDAGLTTLTIALDGSTQDIYTAYRKEGDVDKVKRCAVLIEEAKAKRGSALPYTNLRTVVTRDNERDLPELERFARATGVNMFSYKTLGMANEAELYARYEPESDALRRFAYEGGKRVHRPPVQCPFPFRQPMILWDGTVVGCEYDYEMGDPYGRIGDQPFREFWNGPTAARVRRGFKTGPRADFCGICPYQDRARNDSSLDWKELRKP